MPITFSEYFKLDLPDIKKSGCFDPILDIDSKFFLNFKLLEISKVSFFKSSYKKIQNRFEDIILLVSNSIKPNDRCWREAKRLLIFRETAGTLIGYSKNSRDGKGIGKKLGDLLLGAAKEIINLGIKDPKFFEILGLIEEGIGADRLSDMVINIIIGDLKNFTKSVLRDFKITPQNFPKTNFVDGIPINPFNDLPITLIPKEILQQLPLPDGWNSIDEICFFNNKLRRKINELVGDTWKKFTIKEKKRKIKELIKSDPKILIDLLNDYKKTDSSQYDFDDDPSGEIIWISTLKQIISEYPLNLILKSQKTSDVKKCVKDICDYFKELIENNKLNDLIFYKNEPRHESICQRLFFGIAKAFCEVNNIDISPEVNSGRGSVDFKLSRGSIEKVLVEIKLSKNSKLVNGYKKQLRTYCEAEETNYSFYLVIDVGGPQKRIDTLFAEYKRNLSNKYSPELIYINACLKKSASRL